MAQQQRQHLQARSHRVGHHFQGFYVEREVHHIHHRVAQFVGQRGAQVFARHQTFAHQQLAQRQALALHLQAQRFIEVVGRDQVQRHQRFAQAHHRHAALHVDGFEQLLGRDDLAAHQHIAQALLAQGVLRLHHLLHLALGHQGLVHQNLAHARTHGEAFVGLCGDEKAGGHTLLALGRKQKQALFDLDLANGLALQVFAGAHLHQVGGLGPVCQQRGVGVAAGGLLRTDGLVQREVAQLRKLELDGPLDPSHLHQHLFERQVKVQQLDPVALAAQALNFARQRPLRGLHAGVGGKRGGGPIKGLPGHHVGGLVDGS